MSGAVLLAVAGCSSAEGSSGPGLATSTPSIVLPRSTGPLKPAVDCTKSAEQLPPESQADGVALTASTDPSHTSLLLKNTGNMAVIVMPDAGFTSRLITAPYANPKDQASRSALIAVNNSGGLAGVLDIPAFMPKSQVITLPPQWAVCVLSDSLKEIASARYLQDKPTSAQYFVTKALADQLLVKNSAARTQPTLIRCAKATVDVMKGHATLPDIEQYVAILGPDSPCRNSYQALLHSDPDAADQLATAVLNELQANPRLQASSDLVITTAGN
ncbi:hypothetical protein OHA18_40650 [Kribbella sp. NBC_00709]|uniref:hypothetical protein n=1 Tax=Kribbella sp. NBC_00709 TaxID=2975972 RepID=UPI002E2C163D|nr:hypothetical protein [Kribbella sp. NBC_00709]